jgi:NADP-dependent 3-hydroxy acid dehydrogenase YdfG
VLEYSPYPGLGTTLPQDVTVENLQPEIESLLYGAVAATQAVLPAMLAEKSGTLLYTTGGGAINPYPQLAPVNAAQAALRNLVHNLHNTLRGDGVYAAAVAINVGITAEPIEGYPTRRPDDIAQLYWQLYTERSENEIVVTS